MSQDRSVALQERLDFMRIDHELCALLRDLWPVVEPHLKEVLDGFYEHVSSVPALRQMVEGMIPRLKAEQNKHWGRLFSGRFDEDYFKGVHRIGMIHCKIGLEPRWYIAGYNFVLSRLTEILVRKHKFSPSHMVKVLRAMNSAVMLDMDIAISTYQDALIEERAQRGKKLEALMAAFEGKALSLIEMVATAAYKLQDTSTSLMHVADETIEKSTTVASAAEEASANVQTVASAAEELSASVSEILRQAGQSSNVARRAVGDAEKANQVVAKLSEGAEKIGDIVKMINAIAGQTNLLALNATIEAARAGEMGKGFAVVAGEVKSLANQTAHATDEITAEVNEIRLSTQAAVQAIQDIVHIIHEISDISASIASAVNEQGSATKEIAQNVSEASEGTRLVTVSITSVSEGAAHTGKAASQVGSAAHDLSSEAENLSREVQTFLLSAKAV